MKRILSGLIVLGLMGIYGGCGDSSPDPSPAIPVEANFSISDSIVSAGGSVTFTDLSAGNPTSWMWAFEGGDPETSTEQNPTVVYETLGTFDVTLEAANSDGNNSNILPELIEVVCLIDSIKNQGFFTETFTLDNQSRLIKYNNVIGTTMELHYDHNSRLIKIARFGDTGVFWDTTTFEYSDHLITSSILTTSTGHQIEGSYEYDSQERLERFIFANGEIINYTYDNKGNPIQMETVEPQGTATVDGTFTYDDKINPWSFFNLPRIHYLPIFTSPNNQIKSVTGTNSREYIYVYNELGLPESGQVTEIFSPTTIVTYEVTYYYQCL